MLVNSCVCIFSFFVSIQHSYGGLLGTTTDDDLLGDGDGGGCERTTFTLNEKTRGEQNCALVSCCK